MERIVLIGAGSAMFTRGLVADIIMRKWDCQLALLDTDPDALAVAEGLCKKMIGLASAPIRLAASLDRRDMLSGATVVISTIGVGGRRAWEHDVLVPRRYGIYQPIGDTVMPGGTSRALRMIPAMVAIATDVVELAPDALFFNYANPMAVVCRAVRKATPARMIGLCAGVYEVGIQLADWLGVKRTDFQYTAVGMNHLTWFLTARANGDDLMPRMKQLAIETLAKGFSAEYLNEGSPEHGTAGADDATIRRVQPFCLQLFEVFGAYPAVWDSHVPEFFPGYFPEGRHFGRTFGIDRFSFEGLIERGDARYQQMREVALSKEPLSAEYLASGGGEHVQATEIVESIRLDRGTIFSANLPNQGQVPNLPLDSIIEAPAMATAEGMKPIAQRPLPTGVAGVLKQRFAWIESVVEAALEGNRGKLIQALILDGSVQNFAIAGRLADDLITAHLQYLPQFTSKHRMADPASSPMN